MTSVSGYLPPIHVVIPLSWMVLWPLTATLGFTERVQHQPARAEIATVTATSLRERKGYEPGDLITHSDAKRVLDALADRGWAADPARILADTLPDDDPLVRILTTRQGTRFMRRVREEDLIYDRLDRLCRVAGGQRMLSDITRLPDGEKLAALKRPPGSPGFLELLPKNASGRVRSIKDYNRPTGRIYTQTQLIERLETSLGGSGQPRR